ncbi:uracil-DNA glycosylase family protein [Winogradskyella endarachnes]|uniref:Uracil-DNA glycosylase family protein n=1 Tax=Winogradskyella endarachnes TaxID=2681965 RepID=A0A6L6UA29_9FLAO|nr:uracil-DNA glycosylase family protein [Winogradskyella endarachnes]MUU79191.1 uracil-DNA glycosylase family protein [Winogradskyella endarachnes]
MEDLLYIISQCTICKAHLPLGPRPVVTANPKSKIVIIGQAPGTKVNDSGIPWDDQSGKKLKQWLNVTDEQFYNTENFAIIPMGFCYPGKGKTGDLPPRPECAPQWHKPLLDKMPNVELVILIGAYAQKYYLKNNAKRTLTETVGDYKMYFPKYFPIPHPSPTNRFWRIKNPWFEEFIVPELQNRVEEVLNKPSSSRE